MLLTKVLGTDAKMKELGTKSELVCPVCGELCRMSVFKVCNYFHVLFIPAVKWHVKYIAVASCCAAVLAVPESLGRAFEEGEAPDLAPASLTLLADGKGRRVCACCGVKIRAGYAFCPHCGRRL